MNEEEEKELNRRAAEKLAERKGFDPESVLYCVECGRTVVRTQNISRPGSKDNIFCTCEDYGPPFFSLETNDD